MKAKRQRKKLSGSPENGGEGPSRAPQPAVHSESSDEETHEDEEGGVRIGGVYIPPAPPAICSSEVTGPRLIISHIVNENFKSYAGRQTLGPFHKSLTGIIGPNGSGKSNVIDSMLFVFGYRATKIRSKKISVLIHKSENHQNIRSCSVHVHFAQIKDLPGDDSEIIPNTEIIVSRTAFLDNSSFYTINGKRSQFKDVATLLRSHGIDLVHNRFLILQGEVEQIAMMKPKSQTDHDTGMLEYLEDIIGTARYKVPIEKLHAKVNLLNEERQEKLSRVKMAEKDRDALKGPMAEAVEFLKTENNKTMVHNTLYQKQIYDYENDLLKKTEKLKVVEEAISGIKDQLKTIQEKRTQKEEEITAKRKEQENLKVQKEKYSESFRQVENKATRLKESISQTNKKRKKAIESKKQDELKLIEYSKIPEKNNKEIGELTELEKRLGEKIAVEEASVEKVLASLKEETKELQENKDVLSNQLIGLTKIKNDAKSKYDIAKSELDIYLSNEQKAKARLEELKETLTKTANLLRQRKQEVSELKTKIPDGEKTLKNAQAELAELRKDEAHTVGELNKLRTLVAERKHSLQSNRSRGRVLDFIMKEKEKGNLPGVFGRLGDLGGIQPKYDVAVSTACGPLDYIVVDKVDTAKKCVEALKRSGVGRANFLALEKQERLRQEYQRPLNTPEKVPRLFDLITVEDERVKPAFYYGLRDTLVADDLDQAKRVAYGAKRFRVVTLKGEIIEIAGTMSGGGSHTMRGRMGRSVTLVTDTSSPGGLQKMEQRLNELTTHLNNLQARQVTLEDTVANLSRDTKKWNMDWRNFSIEIEGLSQQEPLLKSQISEQELVVKSSISDPETVERMNTNLEQLKEELDTASDEAGGLEKQVNEISKKISAISGGKMKSAQQKLDSVTNQLDKVRAEITKLKVAISTSGRNVKKTENRLQSLSSEIKDAEESLKKAESENQVLVQDGALLNEKIEKLTKEIINLDEDIEELRGSVNDLVKEEASIKAKKMNEDQKVESVAKQTQELKANISYIKKKLAALKLHDIPEDVNDDDETTTELVKLMPEELDKIEVDRLQYKSTQIDEALKHMKPNLSAIKDYKEKTDLFKLRCKELDDVTRRRNEVKKGHDDARKARLNEFMAGFTVISNKLKEMYQMITLGGDAEFELIDSLDPFSEGVIFSVRPPKKSWKNISNLSGGEKTLSSLALVFALHYYRPSPLYVMDEIDAALDFKNVSIVGHYIKERTKNAQFIIISLRTNMFELADLLVGIYKTYNCTKSVTITPRVYSSLESIKPLVTNGRPREHELLEEFDASEDSDSGEPSAKIRRES